MLLHLPVNQHISPTYTPSHPSHLSYLSQPPISLHSVSPVSPAYFSTPRFTRLMSPTCLTAPHPNPTLNPTLLFPYTSSHPSHLYHLSDLHIFLRLISLISSLPPVSPAFFPIPCLTRLISPTCQLPYLFIPCLTRLITPTCLTAPHPCTLI
jgi:hypothetical protein